MNWAPRTGRLHLLRLPTGIVTALNARVIGQSLIDPELWDNSRTAVAGLLRSASGYG